MEETDQNGMFPKSDGTMPRRLFSSRYLEMRLTTEIEITKQGGKGSDEANLTWDCSTELIRIEPP